MKTVLYVYYGFAKLKPKVARKKEIIILFENARNNPGKNDMNVKRLMHVVHTRKQSKREMEDAQYATRMFTKYSYFPDDKKWKGSVKRILEQNYQADENNVSKKERMIIKNKLYSEYFKFYGLSETEIQLSLF